MNGLPLQGVSRQFSLAARQAQMGQPVTLDSRLAAEQVGGVLDELLEDRRWRASILQGIAARASRCHALVERLSAGDNATSAADVAAELGALRAMALHLPFDERGQDEEAAA